MSRVWNLRKPTKPKLWPEVHQAYHKRMRQMWKISQKNYCDPPIRAVMEKGMLMMSAYSKQCVTRRADLINWLGETLRNASRPQMLPHKGAGILRYLKKVKRNHKIGIDLNYSVLGNLIGCCHSEVPNVTKFFGSSLNSLKTSPRHQTLSKQAFK